MAKRKISRSQELRQNKRRKDEDLKLQSSVFGKVDNNNDISDIEDTPDNDNSQFKNKKQDDIVEEYETHPRAFKNAEEQGIEGLPIRSIDGTMTRVIKKPNKVEEEPESEPEEKEEGIKEEKEEEKKEFNEEEDEAYNNLTPEEKIIKTKEDIADMAEKLIEDPEENVLLLSRLRRMTTSKNALTAKLATLALVPVFKSIAPSYYIRPLTEAEKKEKVTKNIAKLRFFEEHLVLSYKNYIEFLSLKASKFISMPRVSQFDAEMGVLTSNAACELATSLRFFNFRSEVFQIITRRVMRKPQTQYEFENFKKCIKTIEDLLIEDASHGDISFDITRLICKSIKRREFKVDESVINVFLSLTILSDYAPNDDSNEDSPKLKKKDRVHLSKKEKKQFKERKEIESEMKKAELSITAEERERNQAQILKMLLTFYLEILKARPEKLMAAVLESLSKFGHMVNIDLMGDFLQVLREISEDLLIEGSLNGNQVRQILLCIITSFSLVSNLPLKKVSVDLNRFVDYLYCLLPILSQDTDIEFSHKTLRLMDPLASSELNMKPSVNVSTKAELLLRCLDAIFFNSKSGSKKRALAFTKRLYLALLQFPEKTSVAVLKFIDKLLGRYDELKGLYTTEDRIQNGIYHPEADEIERANTEVAVLWENVLLEKHYSPNVAMGAKHLMKKI